MAKKKRGFKAPKVPTRIENDAPEPSRYNHAFEGLDFDGRTLKTLMDNGDYLNAAASVARFLTFFDLMLYNLSALQHEYIVETIDRVYEAVIREDFVIPEPLCETYIRMSVTFSNLLMFSRTINNTDEAIKTVLEQQNNFVRLLFLSSTRNTILPDLEGMFAVDPYSVSVWWETIVNCSTVYTNPICHANLVYIMSHPLFAANYQPISPRMTENRMSYLVNFQVTYIDAKHEKWLKEIINGKIKDLYKNFTIKNTPNPNKILVVSRLYLESHAMYKAISPLLQSLKGHYHLTLLHLAPPEDRVPVDFFDEVFYAHNEDLTINTDDCHKAIRDNDYGMVIYPDVGMSDTSTTLSNLRIAPIQVMCYGHPVSTWGSEIDYFIGGIEAEPENPQRNYSEKLVLIPGTAAYPHVPEITRTHPDKPKEVKIISLSWGLIKINSDTLFALREAKEKAKSHLVFRFTGLMAAKGAFFPACHDLWRILDKNNVEIAVQSDYPDYIKYTEGCHFGADSYPFGGNNRIIDNLIAGVPVICWEGDHAYNRFGAALLRKLGLEELIVTSREEYIDKIVQLADDEAYLQALTDKVNALPIKQIIESDTSPRYFKNAVDYLFANHERLKGESGPIIIQEEA